MTNLYLVLLGSALFAASMLFSNKILQNRWNMSYERQPLIFGLMYTFVAIGALYQAVRYGAFVISATGIAVVAGSIVIYVLFGELWVKRVPAGDHRQRFKIPQSSQIDFQFNAAGQVVKVIEICLQQACALLVVTGLFSLNGDLLWVTVVFVGIVFTVHVPSPKFFGPVFGYFFLVSSVGAALMYPWLISVSVNGFAYMVALHTLVYVYWYSYLINRLHFNKKARE